MNCPNCGVKLASISKFCPECGAKLTAQEEKKNKKEPNSIEELLVTVVQNYGGPELYKESNARKLAGLLKDFAGSNFQDEVKLLSRVVPEGVQELLYNANNSSPEEKQGALAACKMKIIEDLFLLEEKAIQAVNILAAGLCWEVKLEDKSNQNVQTDSRLESQPVTSNTVNVDSYEDDYLENLSLKELLDLENKTQNARVQLYIGRFYDETTKCGKDVNKDNKKAVYWYQKAADQGNARAQCNLGYMYDEGLGVPQNYQKACEWYQKAAEQGNVRAQCNLGYMYEKGNGVPQNYQKACEWYQKAAEQGYARAQCNLGKMYEEGKGVIKNLYKAIEWYTKAAEQGYARAQFNLGYMYDGYMYDEEWASYQKASEWYKKAADQGHARAQYRLGNLYRYGHGVSKDYYQAVELYRKSSEQGNVEALKSLAEMYEYGYGVSRDPNKAIELLERAANQGDVGAQDKLGSIYSGLESMFLKYNLKDYKKAFYWYEKAANQGDSYCQHRIGQLYEDGEGVDKDYKKAIEWYQKAINHGGGIGCSFAERDLGRMYEEGRGVPKNYQKAIELYQAAMEHCGENYDLEKVIKRLKQLL